MTDVAYSRSCYRAPEIEHRYGNQVHLLDDPLAWSQLARLCAPETGQPQVGRLVRVLYERLAQIVVASEFPRARIDVPTRMVVSSPEAVYRGCELAELLDTGVGESSLPEVVAVGLPACALRCS